MEEINFDDFTPESQDALIKAMQEIQGKMREFAELICEIGQMIIEKIREIGKMLSRFFLKMQLLEWKIPEPLAEFIANNIHWRIAFKVGFRWFGNKLRI